MDNSIAKRVKKLQSDLKQYKSPQPVGSDSVRTYTTLSNNEWDVTWVSVDNGGNFWERFRVEFKADHQRAPFGRLRVIADFNGQIYEPSTPSDVYLSGDYFAVSDNVFGTGSSEDFAVADTLRWTIEVSTAVVSTVVRFKFIVDATDTGTLSWDDGQNSGS